MMAGGMAVGRNRKLGAHIFKCQDKASDIKLEMARGFKPSKTPCIHLLPLTRLCPLSPFQTSPLTGDQVFKYPHAYGSISYANHPIWF